MCRSIRGPRAGEIRRRRGRKAGKDSRTWKPNHKNFRKNSDAKVGFSNSLPLRRTLFFMESRSWNNKSRWVVRKAALVGFNSLQTLGSYFSTSLFFFYTPSPSPHSPQSSRVRQRVCVCVCDPGCIITKVYFFPSGELETICFSCRSITRDEVVLCSQLLTSPPRPG